MNNEMPKLSDNYFTERSGVLAVARMVNAMRCIWRETLHPDIGIDGQIENVGEGGLATGHVVAVQVKSGKSYIRPAEESLVYRPSKKHLTYWENFPLPVILVIHDPELNTAYWADARQQLRSRLSSEIDFIRVPMSQTLDREHKSELFHTCGALDAPILAIPDVLRLMITSKTGNTLFDLSFFDLFVFGLIDLCRKLFFSMSLCMQIVDLRLAMAQNEQGSTVSMDEYDFLDAYVRFLVSQNLILFDFSDYLFDLEVLQMVPIFIFPLTSRGRHLIDYIREVYAELSREGLCVRSESVVSERLLEMILVPSDWERLLCMTTFQSAYLKKRSGVNDPDSPTGAQNPRLPRTGGNED